MGGTSFTKGGNIMNFYRQILLLNLRKSSVDMFRRLTGIKSWKKKQKSRKKRREKEYNLTYRLSVQLLHLRSFHSRYRSRKLAVPN